MGSSLMMEARAVDVARECVYRFLAAALSDPRTESFQIALSGESQSLVRAAASLLQEEVGTPALGFGELPPEQLDPGPLLGEFAQPLETLRAEYDRLFGLVLSRECPPYEMEYHPAGDTFFHSQQLADVAGFYNAFGLQTSRTPPERVDHLAQELEFMAIVLLKKRLALDAASSNPESAEQAAVCEDAERDFFRDHLAWWLPSFSLGLRRRAETGPYVALARMLAAFNPVERQHFGIDPPRVPLQPVPIERPEEQAGCGAGSSLV